MLRGNSEAGDEKSRAEVEDLAAALPTRLALRRLWLVVLGLLRCGRISALIFLRHAFFNTATQQTVWERPAAPEVPAVLTKRGDSTVEETTEKARESAEKAARGAQQQVDERKRATAAAIAKTAEAQREGERLTREGQAVARRLQEADGRAAQMEAQLQSVR